MRTTLAGAVFVTALVVTTSASAHAHISPSVVQVKHGEVFTLAVPTEKEGAATTKIEFTPPQGFAIDSFVPTPGWKRSVRQRGAGEEAVVQQVTWTGGRVPTGEDAAFQFLAEADAAKTYAFGVRQTYSDGTVVDWSGPESSDTPSPTLEATSSLGGGGGSSTLAIVALAVAAFALVVALAALVARQGARALA